MKKLFSFLIIAILLIFSSDSFAAVGVRVNGQPYGTATDINFSCGAGINSQPSADGSIFNANCNPNLATSGIANGGATSVASTVTAVPVSFAFIRKVIPSNNDAAFTAGTLANGIPGQVLTIYVAGLSPSGATTGGNYTITPATSTGFRTIKLSAVNDVISLLYIDDSFGWIILTYDPGAASSITITLKN